MKKIILFLTLSLSVALFGDTAYQKGESALQSKEYTDAMKYFYISARHYNVKAYTKLGIMYQEGLGTAVNPLTAFYWCQKAAQRNQPEAQYRLGQLYETGLGAKSNAKQAAVWYRRAAKNGNKNAKARLAGKEIGSSAPKTEESESFFGSLAFWEKSNDKSDNKESQVKSTEKPTQEQTSKTDDNGSILDTLLFWRDQNSSEPIDETKTEAEKDETPIIENSHDLDDDTSY
jgi:TPR repeat protein